MKAIALALLIFVPLSTAQTTQDLIWEPGEEGRLLQWRVMEQNFEDSNAVKMGNFSWLRFTTFGKAIPESIILIEISTTLTVAENANGVWNYTVQMANGGGNINLGACYWHVRTVNAGVLGGNLVTKSNYDIQCAGVVEDVAEDSNIKFWINRTTLSGTPSVPSHNHISIYADRGDFVVLTMKTDFELLTGLTALEFAIFPLLAFIGYILWGRATDSAVRAFGAVLGMIAGALLLGFAIAAGIGDIWAGTIAFAVILFIFGGYLLVRLFLDAFLERDAA